MTERDRGNGRLELPADAGTIRDEQVERALRRLEDCGDLTPQQRAEVERVADRLTATLRALFAEDRTDMADAGGDDSRALLSPD